MRPGHSSDTCQFLSVVAGPTGSGKTTQVPQYIVDTPKLLPQNAPVVIVTQPRRLAAINVAQRVAEERGQAVGDEVGYIVRFENRLGPNTRLIFMTSGVLLRRLQEDPALEGVGLCLSFDPRPPRVRTVPVKAHTNCSDCHERCGLEHDTRSRRGSTGLLCMTHVTMCSVLDEASPRDCMCLWHFFALEASV